MIATTPTPKITYFGTLMHMDPFNHGWYNREIHAYTSKSPSKIGFIALLLDVVYGKYGREVRHCMRRIEGWKFDRWDQANPFVMHAQCRIEKTFKMGHWV